MRNSDIDEQKYIKQCLQDIANNGDKIARIIKTSEDHFENGDMQAAVERYFEIIGEASNRLSKEFRNNNGSVPWKKIIGMRNVIIHRYDDVDPKELLLTAHYTLPNLVSYAKKKIKELEENE